MKKMTKEQSSIFNELFEETLYWGDMEEYGMCNGLFSEFGENLEYLSTGVDEERGNLELFYCAGIYDADGIGVIPINSKTKARLKKVVQHLMSDGFDSLIV